MESTELFREDKVKALLGGSPADATRGLEQIAVHLRFGICGWIRRQFPGMSPEDLADTWQETLVSVLRAVREKQFDRSRELAPWVATLAYRRAVDLLRRRTTDGEALDAVRAALEETPLGDWRRELGRMQSAEVFELVRREIVALPERQRVVLQVFSDHYPETASMERLRVLVAETSGETVSLAAVKRALQEGRRKLRTVLGRHGFSNTRNES